MTLLDDGVFLVGRIRAAFIAGDETGMAEMVIVNDIWPRKKPGRDSSRLYSVQTDESESETETAEGAHSLEIVSDIGLGAHRRRSNTAQRLDRLKKERQSQAKIKHIQWKENPGPILEEDLNELFSRKTLQRALNASNPKLKPNSLLSEQLEKLPTLPNNPFNEYAKFDGNAYASIPTRKINIYLTMQPPNIRAYPMPVVVVATARIIDLIGLICWQYTNEGRQPKLKENVDYYSLHIAEDDGEADLDFPSLDTREIISKFGFSILALLQNAVPVDSASKQTVIIYIPSEPKLDILVKNPDMTVKELLDEAINRRRVTAGKRGLEYHLEKKNEPGKKLEGDAAILSLDTMELCLVRTHSKRVDDDDMGWPISGMSAVEAPLYQSYRVNSLSKVRTKVPVHLGISGEKLEMDPVQQKGSSRLPWTRNQKPVSYNTDSIAACEMIEVKPTGKAVLRLIVSVGGRDHYKHHDLETESVTAKEIVQKINNILEMRSSRVRRDYVAQLERKYTPRQNK